ncbi:MAG: glutamate--tRNA ligase [Candidatus Karelsulcia muelleri]|nr:MAG: glutamate--tRNA ligase [Candidatus Karelsulcia muelleri]
MKKVRVRFAPSPTGPLHLGSIRTALYNFLFAKKNKGKFILRIEDTDRSRYKSGAENYIIKSLKWCGLTVDEGPTMKGNYGPYRQSERYEIYKKYIKYLLANDFAYYAFEKKKKKRNYNRKKLDLNISNEKTFKKIINGIVFVIRFKIPKFFVLKIKDFLRGKIIMNFNSLDEKIILKSDGTPTYHLANVIDDHLMKISHVLKGEEWLSSFPINICLYKSFYWIPPIFFHLPLILNPLGQGKISKRKILKFPIFPLGWKDKKTSQKYKGYRESGYFPEAFINMLVFLGWNPGGTKEIFSLKNLISIFKIEDINISSAKFNFKKAEWFNCKYFKQKTSKEILFLLKKELKKRNIFYIKIKNIFLLKIINFLRKKCSFLNEIRNQTIYLFKSPDLNEKFCFKKNLKRFHSLIWIFLNEKKFNILNIKTLIQKLDFSISKKRYSIMQLLRISLVGSLKGLDLFFIISIIGKKESLKRIIKFLNYCL